MDFIYCPKCGTKLEEREIGDEGVVPFCASCDRPYFSFSYPCVIVATVNQAGEIALIKQSYGFKDAFVCVAGYIKSDETAENCVRREVEEEIGLRVNRLEYLGSYSLAQRDNLMLGFAAFTKDTDFVCSKEVAQARWFEPRDAADTLWSGSIAQMVVEEYIKRYVPC